MKRLLPFFILLFAATMFGQSDLPDKGSLEDIKGKSKAYLVSDTLNAKVIVKEITKDKSLTLIDKADEADFVIEFKSISSEPVGQTGMSIMTGQMDVYIFRAGKRMIVWTDSAQKSTSYPSVALINRFIKARKAKEPSK